MDQADEILKDAEALSDAVAREIFGDVAEPVPVIESVPLASYKKAHFAADIEENESFDEVFVLEDVSRRKKKKNGVYWTITLRDRTGTIRGKVWSADAWEEETADNDLALRGQYVKIRARSSEYNGEVELTVDKIRGLTAWESVDIRDFVPVGPNDRFAGMNTLANFVANMRHPGLRAVCDAVLTDPALHSAFRDAPASTTNHHPYVGGLLDHTLSLVRLIYPLTQHYRSTASREDREAGRPAIDEDLLVAAAIFHDIGKTRELRWDKSIAYTPEGNVVGHVVIGLEMLDVLRPLYWEACHVHGALAEPWKDRVEAARDKWTHLRHIIASHHGKLEWGAAKVPMTREAWLFHLADMVDSRMAGFDRVDRESVDEDGFTPWFPMLGGKAWRPML